MMHVTLLFAQTPVQMAELAKGTVGSKLSLLLGAEYMGGKYSYTTQHVLQDGSRVHVSRFHNHLPVHCVTKPPTCQDMAMYAVIA